MVAASPGFLFLRHGLQPVEHHSSPKSEYGSLWTPSNPEATAMYQFQQSVGIEGSYEELWKWSVENSDEFWINLMNFVDLEYSGTTTPVKEGSIMPDVTYFPNVEINFAKNLLRYAEDEDMKDVEAIVSVSEARDIKRWSFKE